MNYAESGGDDRQSAVLPLCGLIQTQMSITKRSPVLGRLTYDAQFRHFSTTIAHNRQPIRLTLTIDSENSIDELLPFAERVWRGRARHIKAFREFAVSELLDELNEFLVADDPDCEIIAPKELRQILRVPFAMTFQRDSRNGDAMGFSLSGGEAEYLREHCVAVFFAADGSIKGGEVIRLF